jgi:hypothetical protein
LDHFLSESDRELSANVRSQRSSRREVIQRQRDQWLASQQRPLRRFSFLSAFGSQRSPDSSRSLSRHSQNAVVSFVVNVSGNPKYSDFVPVTGRKSNKENHVDDIPLNGNLMIDPNDYDINRQLVLHCLSKDEGKSDKQTSQRGNSRHSPRRESVELFRDDSRGCDSPLHSVAEKKTQEFVIPRLWPVKVSPEAVEFNPLDLI